MLTPVQRIAFNAVSSVQASQKEFFSYPEDSKKMTGKISKFSFSVILLLCFLGYPATFGLPSCLDCQETPEFIYRVNSREPSIIFQQGMQSLGDNKNLFQHVTGASCSLGPLKNSAFVATTLSIIFARLFSIQMLWQPSNAPEFVYVYTIRATEFFYDVGASLIKGYKETGNGDYEEVADLFSNEEEWVAYQGIPREQFKSVAVYSRGSTYASAKFVRTEKNPFYVHKRTRGNRDVFPLNGKVTTVSLVATSSSDPVSARFTFCFSKKSARFDSSGACPMKQMVYQAELSAKGSYWDSTNNHHSEGLLPWKEVTSTEGSHKVERPEE